MQINPEIAATTIQPIASKITKCVGISETTKIL
jgi:hypothetical protein